MVKDNENLMLLKSYILREKELANRLGLIGSQRGKERQADFLILQLREVNTMIPKILERIDIAQPLRSDSIQKIRARPLRQNNLTAQNAKPIENQEENNNEHKEEKHTEQTPQEILSSEEYLKKTSEFEKQTLKRVLKKEEREKKRKEKKPNAYISMANSLFGDFSANLLKSKMFRTLKRDLIKANLSILPASYISIIFFTTLISIFVGIILFVFFLFFKVSIEFPFIFGIDEAVSLRFLKVIWILFVVPIITFFFMYVYPSLERKSSEHKIDQELPFAAIHMAAISGSMIEPSRIFKILITTEEYGAIKKEFTKLINEINVYGYDLVSALRNSAYNSASKKLGELFNGVATTISSGGNLPNFFEKRAQSLLFDYRLEREKYTRTAETFMDIYITVVIAAPMIFMLLLMMIKISGLGIGISSQMITLLMILGVVGINILFITFLHLKQPTT